MVSEYKGHVMTRFLFFILLLFAIPVQAHPPVSIVIDSRGNVFYSDLEQVWMIAPDGSKTIAVQHVHTHELWIGPDDTLYGEDVANVGDSYRHRIWKRTPDGQIENELEWREGHPDDFNDYSFARDASGLMYALVRSEKQIKILRDNEVIQTIALDSHEGFVHWLIVQPDGTIFLTIGKSLIQIKPGTTEGIVLANHLIERTPAFDFLHDRHALMGLWTDTKNNVYVSVFSGQQVKQISPDGIASVPFRQSGKWSITGGAIDSQGRVWLLEFSSDNQVRVRRIGQDEETIF